MLSPNSGLLWFLFNTCLWKCSCEIRTWSPIVDSSGFFSLTSSSWGFSSGLAPLTQAVNLWVISALCFVSVALSGLGKIVEMNASILCLGWAWLLVGTLVQLSLSTYLGTHLWHVWGLGGGTGCSSLFLPLLSYLHWQCGCEGSLGSGRSAFGKRSTSIHMPGKTLQCGQKSIAVCMVVEKQADVWADSAGRSLRQEAQRFQISVGYRTRPYLNRPFSNNSFSILHFPSSSG